MRFTRHIGIDYSGAQTPESRLRALQVYEAPNGNAPIKVNTPAEGAKNWTRLEVAQFCAAAIETGEPVIIGIDHAFSFPMTYMHRFGIETWDQFLDDFMRAWPTADPHTYVDSVRDGNPRNGEATELRLCDQWTSGAKSVFQFDVQGQVATSTHAGLPWLLWLRMMFESKSRIYFWPFDGFDVPEGKSVVAEMYPSLFRRRYPKEDRTADEHRSRRVLSRVASPARRRPQSPPSSGTGSFQTAALPA